jgi:hypothetical protein
MLATAPIVGAPISRAQCTITGPTQVCPGEMIELCGPALDNVSYLWQGPDGTLYMTDCIDVFDPGLYTLKMRDLVTRVWTQPCSLTVQSGRVDAPAITGSASTCSGTPVNWCGPTGSFDYAWNGPNGFAATTACVTVADAGDYFLRVRPLPAGCWGDSTARSLTVTNCAPATVNNCPRPAWWWSQQGSEWDRWHGRLDRSQIATVAGCVDDHSDALSWSDDAAGFIRTMQHERRTLRMRARRQFAAAWANVCAGQLGVTPRIGPPVALDPASPMDAGLGGGTIASWLAFADVELARLEGTSERNRSAKESYRRLIRTGWHINHGLGIGTTCQPNLHDDARMAVEAGMAVAEDELEPLAAELVDEGDGPLAFGALEPNPFSTQTSLAFSVSTTVSAAVSIGVYDVSGRLIRELARGPYAPGQYVVRWDGSASDGAPVRSGLYFIRGRIGDQQVQSRVSFIR